MSTKKHVIVPRGFTVVDVEQQLTDRSSRALFHHMSGTEATALAAAGKITRLGETGKVWQLTKDSFTHSDRVASGGRVSLEIPSKLQSFMESEMSRRPSWCLTIDP